MAENVKQLSRLGFWIGLRDIDKNGVDYKLLSSGQLPSFTQWDQSPKIQPDNEWHRWVTINKKFGEINFTKKFHEKISWN